MANPIFGSGPGQLPAANASPTFGTPFIAGYLVESFADNITAHAGGGQANAFQLSNELSRITTVATAGDSCVLPPSQAGMTIIVVNHGSNPMQMFGYSADQIDDNTSGTGVQQMTSSMVIYSCYTQGFWYTEGLATGFDRSTSLQTFSALDGIVANSGGVQSGATPLTAMMNRIATVGGAGYSCLLPTSVSGLQITVINGAATNASNIYPVGTDQINSLGASAAFSLGAGHSCEFVCCTAGQWYTLPLAP